MTVDEHLHERLDTIRQLVAARWVAVAWQDADDTWHPHVRGRDAMLPQAQERFARQLSACLTTGGHDAERWRKFLHAWRAQHGRLHAFTLGAARPAYYAVVWDRERDPLEASTDLPAWLDLAFATTVSLAALSSQSASSWSLRQAVLDGATSLSAAATPEHLLAQGLALAGRLLDAQGSAYYESDHPEGPLEARHVEAEGELRCALQSGPPFSAEQAEEMLNTRKPLVFSVDPDRSAPGSPITQVVAVPCTHQGNSRAALAIARSTPCPFTELDSTTLVLYTRQWLAVMENRRLLARLKAANHELSTTQAQLVESARLQTLGEVAARVAHDFNNILGALLGRVQLLQHSVSEPVIQTALGKMERLIITGEATVKQLQAAARVRTADPEQAHTLTGVIREVFAESESSLRNQTQIDNRKIIWHTRFKPTGLVLDRPQQLRGALRQILTDLATRAPEDSIVELHTGRDGGTDVLKIGLVPPQAESTVHWRWETVTGHQSLTEAVDHLQGELQYKSVSTGAQELHVRLGSPPDDTPHAPSAERKYHVLVVDDDREVREVLEELLETDGHTVTSAADGAQALQLFAAEQHDIVFTDLGMPGISGWQVAEMVKREAPKTPVVLITGWGSQIEAEKIRASSVDRVLSKPFQWFSVLEVLRELGTRRST